MANHHYFREPPYSINQGLHVFTHPDCPWYQHEGELLHTTRNHRVAESCPGAGFNPSTVQPQRLPINRFSQFPRSFHKYPLVIKINQAWQWRIPYFNGGLQ